MRTQESLVGLACQVNDQIAQALVPVLREHHLSPAMFDLLSAIRAGDGRETQAEIGARVGLSRATISEAVSALQAKGYVQRQPSETDARAVLLSLTGTGHRKVTAILNELKRIEAEAVESLSEKETDVLAKSLKKLILAIKNRS
jgi:DNA-binding MarR family transcriptional regulator